MSHLANTTSDTLVSAGGCNAGSQSRNSASKAAYDIRHGIANLKECLLNSIPNIINDDHDRSRNQSHQNPILYSGGTLFIEEKSLDG